MDLRHDPRSSSAPERVLLASSERGLYGGERQLLLLAEALRTRGHELLILARAHGCLARRAAESGMTVCLYEPGPWPWRLWRLRRAIARFRPDVLHCNDPRALSSAGIAALALGIPCRTAARRVSFPLRSPRLYRRLADRLICVSEAVRARCAEAGIAPERLALVPDAVDPARIGDGDGARLRAALDLPSDAPLLVVVASLTPCKGHDVLLRALPTVWERHPDTRVLLAGDGPLRARLEARAGDLPAGRLRLLGYRDDVGDLLAAATALVMPSLQEGFGSASAEAAWGGVPVVASRVGGLPDLLDAAEDGPAGWLVPPGDAEALGAALVELLDRPDLARERADRARSRARERHAPERLVEGTLAVWRTVSRRA